MEQQKSRKIALLRNLNAVQKEAVENIDGPNLILAGAGSGKTRVLTHKIAYLIDRKKVKPENILAMTFTNKAAREMKDRIIDLLHGDIRGLWIGTFHSNFARILRKNCDKLRYTSNFVIYDETDQLNFIKSIIKELEIVDNQRIKPKFVQSKIKFIKNSLISLEELRSQDNITFNDIFCEIYNHYQIRLQQNNALDFEDLLLKSIELFTLFPSVLEYYQNHFRYILIDEYQDTNRAQYELIKLLSAKHKNISVVGDDDQSIYRWRGADIRNILEFENDFPDCKIFRLEQNYRSTINILKVAHSIISHNFNRMDKELWTKNETGEKVTLKIVGTAEDEARYIVQKIEQEIQLNQRNFSDFAILYRINAQSRALEDVLKNKRISYIVVGGIRFYERKEIKDVLAYLRVLINPKDSVSLKRIINYPQRGIGDATIEKLERYSRENEISLFESLKNAHKINSIAKKKQDVIFDFYNFLKKYQKLKSTIPPGELVTALIEDLGIFSSLKEEGTFEAYNRIENIRELISGINEFTKENPELTLEHYLENVALITNIDNWDSSANAVSLLTLHGAKGLEFPVVFIAGLEEGLFPLSRQLANKDDLEEERRLFYVGATRAQEKLYLTAAKYRRHGGEMSNGAISRFISELNRNFINFDDSDKEYPTHERKRKVTASEKIYTSDTLQEVTEKSLKPGMLIRHPHFGMGVIRKIERKDDDFKASILFEELGEKNIFLKYCKLEIIE